MHTATIVPLSLSVRNQIRLVREAESREENAGRRAIGGRPIKEAALQQAQAYLNEGSRSIADRH